MKNKEENKEIKKEENKEIKKEENKEIKKEEKKAEVIEITKEEIEALNKKIDEAEEKFLRSQAELVNYRKRKDEEVARLLKYANEDVILEILPVLDNFERAIKLDDDNLDDDLSKFLSGFKMIYASLLSALEKYGVAKIDAINKEFDENMHQAVSTTNIEEKDDNIVVDVYQSGYILKDKVLRPAMVLVNKK